MEAAAETIKETPAQGPVDAPKEQPEVENRPIRRGRIGVNVFIQLTLGVALFALVNYLGWRHYKQWDNTFNKEYTLSEDTLEFLKQLDKKVEITVLSLKGSEEQRSLWALAEQFHRNGRGKFRIQLVDP